MKSPIFKQFGLLALAAALALALAAPAWGAARASVCFTTSITVSNANDSGAGSLRQAILESCSGGLITFADGLSGATITLTTGQLSIARGMSIDGSSLATPVTISGGGSSRIFDIPTGESVSLESLVLKDGFVGNSTSSSGAAIYSDANLTLSNLTFTNNQTNANQGAGSIIVSKSMGGAIYNNGPLTISNSTFAGNHATSDVWSYGGAIYNASGRALTIVNSTFSGNSASSSSMPQSEFVSNSSALGGAIFNAGALLLINSTLFGNSATDYGGGIYNDNSAIVKNTIIAGSTSGGNCAEINFDGDFSTNNLSDDVSCVGHVTVKTSGEVNLGPLGDYGGPTQTIPLLAGSWAIDHGDNIVCAAAPVNNLDQRGVKRPFWTGWTCDIGAFEYDPLTVVIVDESTPADGAVLAAAPGSLVVRFNNNVLHDGSEGAADNPDNYLLVEAGEDGAFDTQSCSSGLVSDDKKISVDSPIIYDSELYTATLTVNGGAPLPAGYYRLFICGTTSITDFYNLKLNYGLSDTPITFRVTILPTITLVNPPSGPIAGGTVVTITGTSFTGATAVTFGGMNAATFKVDSATQITATTPAHAAGAVTVTVTTPGGTATKASAFTYIAPATSAAPAPVPATGFAPSRVTVLQPQTVSYADLGDLWLEIPALGVQMPIVGIPQTDGAWDVSWLGKDAGWLNGSAFPTWAGNSVLTGHVYDANGKPGPFAGLNRLWYGSQVIVHAWGGQYVYAVRSVMQVAPGDTAAMMKHQELPWLTLVTCRGYDQASNSYKYRVLVRAVLVEVK